MTFRSNLATDATINSAIAEHFGLCPAEAETAAMYKLNPILGRIDYTSSRSLNSADRSVACLRPWAIGLSDACQRRHMLSWLDYYEGKIREARAKIAQGDTETDVSAAIGRSILALMAGCDLLGFNLRRLDLPILDATLRRCGLRLDLTGVNVIDAGGIFHKKEPRTLAGAVQKYCGHEHDGAHGAGADVAATLAVLQGQLAVYPDLAAMSLEELAKFSTLGDFEPVDLAGKLGRDKDGDMVFNFGQKRGTKIKDDTGFAFWMIRKDFPASTIEALEAELHRIAEPPIRDEPLTLAGEGDVEDVAETGAPMVDPRTIGAGWEKG